jgi:hypothetical protein
MMQKSNHRRILARTTVLLLVFAVAGVSILAKYIQYSPKSDPIHFFSKATKVDVAHHPVDFAADPLYQVVAAVPPLPTFRTIQLVEPESFHHLREISVTVSLQHRSPPSLLV